MGVPYFMDGKAQMKIVKERKEKNKERNMATTSQWGKNIKKTTGFFCKQ